jgi:Tfp pilus assembly protein PilO
MFAQLQNLPTRTLWLIAGSLVCLTLLAAYLYLFKRPAAEYRNLSQEYQELAAELGVNSPKTGIIEQLQRELDRLNVALHGARNSMTIKQFQAHMVGRLDEMAMHRQIQLVGVRPGAGQSVLMFEELPFDIEVRGDYLRVYDWMQDVVQALKPITVKQFEVQPDANFEDVQMKMTVVSYRVAEGNG